jgi:hypothetical protein
MLTEEFLKDNFLNAYFIDNERQNIEILSTSEDKQSVVNNIIPYDVKHPYFIALSKVCNVDQIHENTYNKKKKEREIFEQKVIEIAKRDGLLLDNTKIDSNYFSTVIKAIFTESENTDHIFALKLALFELNEIKDSTNEELKKKLRQAKTKIEVLQTAFDLIK